LKYVTTPFCNNCFILQIEDPLLSTPRFEVPTTEVQVPTTEVQVPTTEVQVPTTEVQILKDLTEGVRTMMIETDPTNPNPEVNVEASGSSLEGKSWVTRPKSTQKK
jgi:hypothetical protein